MFRFNEKIKSALAAVALSILTVGSADAATFTVDGVDFELTTVSGSFNDNRALLESQVWWGNAELAEALAETVKDGLGLTIFSDGPAFAFGTNPGTTAPVVDYFFYDAGNTVRGPFVKRASFGLTQPLSFDFAVAVAAPSPVPLPAGGVLLVTGLAGVAHLKRRKAKRG